MSEINVFSLIDQCINNINYDFKQSHIPIEIYKSDETKDSVSYSIGFGLHMNGINYIDLDSLEISFTEDIKYFIEDKIGNYSLNFTWLPGFKGFTVVKDKI